MKSSRSFSEFESPQWPIPCWRTGAATKDQPFEVDHYTDFAALQGKLAAQTGRLFAAINMKLEACVVNYHATTPSEIQSLEQLSTYLKQLIIRVSAEADPELQSSSTIFCLYQSNRWGRLKISEAAAKTLLSHLETFPPFLEVLQNFGMTKGPQNEGWGCMYGAITEPSAGEHDFTFECAYILRYPKLHDRPGSMDPWSVRQIGLYQKYTTLSKRGTYIILEPSSDLQRRLREVCKPGTHEVKDFLSHWTSFHLLCLGSLEGNWQQYINFLHEQVESIDNVVRFSSLNPQRDEAYLPKAEVTFQDMQRLQYFSDKLLRASHVLKTNISTLAAIAEESNKAQMLEDSTQSRRYTMLHKALSTKSREFGFILENTQSLCKRTERMTTVLRDAIALQDNQTMKDLARLSSQESDIMLRLTRDSIREAKAMKTITFVALVYLPASFTAAFCSMGYIKVQSLEGGISLAVSREMWFYMAMTLPLMLFTMTAWFCWERWSARRTKYLDDICRDRHPQDPDPLVG
ncbi:hypothetical protein BDD12DRAFT_911130 [Trichophaea hybrida]|nr:hypothetical protein BDD12DRAFT_911130 [Trichophaea hybrida]